LGFRESAVEDLAMTGATSVAFWRDKRVLLTGHTGFKGSWLTQWLHGLGAKVTGIALPPATKPSLYTEAEVGGLCESEFCDIRDASALIRRAQAARPEIVFHLAAQPLVRMGYRQPRMTFETNVMGTVHLLEALRGLAGVRVAVMVTTDKVYFDSGNARPYREDDALGGFDPYSASKAACELVVASYRDAFLAGQGVAVASARAGNVIGGGDWSEDRLIPDAVRAWQAGRALEVRRPRAVRPWQHVLEPLAGYLALAWRLWQQPALAGAYNFGPDIADAVAVRDVVEMARLAYGEGDVCYGDGSGGPHESASLTLDVSKARAELGVAPSLALKEAINWSMAWYRAHARGANARQLCEGNIDKFAQRPLGRTAPSHRVAAI
jgi:CDP-glucose 4,6-dehydratase